MLRPLLYLSALVTLAGARQTFTASSEFDISSCPVTFYGQEYEQVYVNFTGENFVVCFTHFSNAEPQNDCLVGTPPDSEKAGFEIFPRLAILEKLVLNNVPTIGTRMECFVGLSLEQNGAYATLALIKFGTQSAVYVYSPGVGTVVVDVQVDGNSVDSLSVTNTPEKKESRGYLDISGCRHSGVLYKPGSEVNSPETCLFLTCDDTAVLRYSACGPLERCQGNGSCIPGTSFKPTLGTTLGAMVDTPQEVLLEPVSVCTCTVIGPAIIDIHGHVNFVGDRCAYSMLSSPSVPDFHMLANFQERRRKDVSFLDSVTIQLDGPGVHIHLEQGRRVRVNESTLILNSSAQLVHGVELSQDQTGLRAKLSLTNLTASVFFDGNMVQIHLEGPAASSLRGLCGNSSGSLGELRLSEFSSTSCEAQHSDAADSTINCTRMSRRCRLLEGAPFSSCSVDPEPYITACSHTLCRYPALDGLSCQFLEAYSRACSLHSAPPEGWRSKAECSSEALCQSTTCSAHEFCGQEAAGGEARCFCRALYASTHTGAHSLVCRRNSASLTLAVCLLEDKGVAYTDLHLQDRACRGQLDEPTHTVAFSFSSSSCGTHTTTNSTHIIHKNALMVQTSSSDHDRVFMDFSCVYDRDDSETVMIRNSSVIHVVTSGVWDYTLTLKAFLDAERTQAVESDTEVRLNQRVWVELDADGLDGDTVAVVMDSCWATEEASQDGSRRYDLIRNGCPNPGDAAVKVEGNGLGTSNFFSFDMFEFSESSEDIYLHCKLLLCFKQEDSCVPQCNKAGRRRSVGSRHEAGTFLSLRWTNQVVSTVTQTD